VRVDTRSGALRAAGFRAYGGMPAVVPGAGRAFDTAAPGALALLDARTGAPLRTIPLPAAQGSTYGVLDAQAGRLYTAFEALPSLLVLDARTGRALGSARTCLAASGIGVSHVAGLGACGCGVVADDRRWAPVGRREQDHRAVNAPGCGQVSATDRQRTTA